MKTYLLGVATIPAILLAKFLFGLIYRTTRDTIRRWKQLELKDGYGRWHWIYLAPLVWWDMLKQQLWSWANGIESEIR